MVASSENAPDQSIAQGDSPVNIGQEPITIAAARYRSALRLLPIGSPWACAHRLATLPFLELFRSVGASETLHPLSETSRGTLLPQALAHPRSSL